MIGERDIAINISIYKQKLQRLVTLVFKECTTEILIVMKIDDKYQHPFLATKVVERHTDNLYIKGHILVRNRK